MPRLAYVNHAFVPLDKAAVHVEDRGFQFADGIYEVCAVLNSQLLDWPLHLERWTRNLAALLIPATMSAAALTLVARRLIALNGYRDALLYIQVTRGEARRDHPFPADAQPTLVMTVRRFDFAARVPQQAVGVKVTSVTDQRWGRCDIKTVALLPNVLAKQTARLAGSFEAWFVSNDGVVAEGGSTNAWIVDAAGTVITHPLSARILPGIMRASLLRLAHAAQIKVEERAFTLAEAQAAPEAFLTSTTAPCLGIVEIDGVTVGDGKPGPVTRRLGELLWAEIERQTGFRPPAA
jgi:D-alanine transaminase